MLLGAAAACLAAAPATIASAEQISKWEVGVGGVFFTQPAYVGSDEYRFHAYPFPWLVYRGSWLRLDRESIQAKIFGTSRIRLDLSAGGQIPVDSDDADRRHGMKDLDWMAQLGPSLKFRLGMSYDGRHVLDFDVPVRSAFAIDTNRFAYEGIVASPRLVYRWEPEEYRVEVDAGVEFTSNDYNEYVYGVAPAYATATRRAYDPDGGYAGFRLAAGLHRYWRSIYYGVFVRYINVSGATFDDSPVVATDNAVVAGIAFGWIWFKSKDEVPDGAEANLLSDPANMPPPPPGRDRR